MKKNIQRGLWRETITFMRSVKKRIKNVFLKILCKCGAEINTNNLQLHAASDTIKKCYHFWRTPIGDLQRVIVYMTEKNVHVGLADQLRTIRTAYVCAAENDRRFYLYHNVGGFRLEEYLEPNEIDWKIKEQEINFGLNCVGLEFFYRKIPTLKNKKREYHLYSSGGIFAEMDHSDLKGTYTDHSCHRKLFKPTERLCSLVSEVMEKYELKENEYIVFHLRFTNFFEQVELEGAVTSTEQERRQMIIDVHQVIDEVYKASGCKKVLLFSDSNIFLNSEHPNYVTVIPGHVGHVSKYKKEQEIIDKTFIDLFLMSKGKVVYSIRGKNIYGGGFSREASIIGNKPFIELPLKKGSREGFIGTY